VAIDPAHADALTNLGKLLVCTDRPDEAVVCLHQALRLKPDFAEARGNLCIAYHRLGLVNAQGHQFENAVTCFERAIEAGPNFAEGHNGLGVTLFNLGRFQEAESCYRKAVRIQPNYATAHWNLANILLHQARVEEALKSFQEALRLEPENRQASSEYLIASNYLPNADPGFVFAEHCRWGPPLESPAVESPAPAWSRHSGEPLRVGYMSPDFRHHIVTRFLEPILRHHDSNRVRVFCYAEVKAPDETTSRIQSLSHTWRQSYGLTDDEVAEQVRADGIDILVDLAGHIEGNRLGVFARNPAPVQVSYLGYPNTTGLPTIDYRLTDDVADPPGESRRHTEELVRLPGGFCCYQPWQGIPEVTPLPAIRTRCVTFGSFHRPAKLNQDVIHLWCQVLEAVPSSKLLLCRSEFTGPIKEHLAEKFAAHGIQEGRVEIRYAPAPRFGALTEYLHLYEEIDIFLDAIPWTGHGTACEAMWMGVPVLTLRGKSHAGRMVAATLSCARLGAWIADTPAKYVELAARWAGELEELADLRLRLREFVQSAPLCDAKRFTRSLEDAYFAMWERVGGQVDTQTACR
jgi:predicted O-linked N-acetylglucosamine transferase (SPINDLY family)